MANKAQSFFVNSEWIYSVREKDILKFVHYFIEKYLNLRNKYKKIDDTNKNYIIGSSVAANFIYFTY